MIILNQFILIINVKLISFDQHMENSIKGLLTISMVNMVVQNVQWKL
jgi:hypothetical protein